MRCPFKLCLYHLSLHVSLLCDSFYKNGEIPNATSLAFPFYFVPSPYHLDSSSLPRECVARLFPSRLVWRSKREWSTYRRLIRFSHGCSGYYPLRHPSCKSRNARAWKCPRFIRLIRRGRATRINDDDVRDLFFT